MAENEVRVTIVAEDQATPVFRAVEGSMKHFERETGIAMTSLEKRVSEAYSKINDVTTALTSNIAANTDRFINRLKVAENISETWASASWHKNWESHTSTVGEDINSQFGKSAELQKLGSYFAEMSRVSEKNAQFFAKDMQSQDSAFARARESYEQYENQMASAYATAMHNSRERAKQEAAEYNRMLETYQLAKLKAKADDEAAAAKQKEAEEAKRKAIIDAAAERTAERKKKEAAEAAEAAKKEAIELEKIRKELVAIERAQIEGNFRKYFSDVSKKNKGFSAYVQAEEDLKIQRAIARHQRRHSVRTRSAEQVPRDTTLPDGNTLNATLGTDAAEFDIDPFAISLTKASNALGTLSNIGKTVGKTVLPRVAQAFKLTAVYSAKFAANIGKLAIGGLVKKFKALASSISTLNKRMSRFVSQLGRIIVYRAFRAFLGEISNGFNEGAKSLYNWSSQFEKTKAFKTSLDSMTTSLQYLRNSVAAAVEPIANALAPIVEDLTNRFVELINVMSQFFAMMTGQNYWTKAIRKEALFEEAAESAGSAVEKQLLGFDEINKLSDNSGSSSSSDDAEGLFDTVEEFLDVQNFDLVERIKESIQQGDWKGVGTIIAEKVNWVWDKLNFSGITERVGEVVDKVIGIYNGLTENIKWEQIGNDISTGLMGFVEKISPENLGTALSQKIKAVVELAKGFLLTFDATKVGKWISTVINSWINNIPVADFFTCLTALVNKTVTLARTIITDFPWKTVATSISTGINSAISGVRWDNLGNMLSSAVHGFLSFIKTGIETIKWGEVGKAVYECLTAIDWKQIFKDLAGIIFDAMKAAVEIIGGFASGLFDSPSNVSSSTYYGQHQGSSSPSTLSKNVNVRTAFASGGYPTAGSMFIAGESGAEFVGNINGRTGVMNTDQFSEANRPVTEAVYAIGSAIVGAVNGIEMPSVKIGDREIYKASERGKRLTGSSLVIGAR